MPDFLAGLCDPDTLQMLAEGTLDTLYMTLASTFFAYVFGMIMAVVLVVCRADGIRPCPGLYKVLDVVVNLTRSFPFLILMIAVIPLTRFLVGTTIGNNATVVPLVIAAAPFVARLIESSLLEVDHGIVEAAQSMGCGRLDIICRVYLRESIPAIARGVTITLISLIGLTAMAGAVGAGGLGNFAYVYGQQRSRMDIIYSTVIVLVAIVTVIQLLGSLVARISKH